MGSARRRLDRAHKAKVTEQLKGKGKVALAYLHSDEVSSVFHTSVLQMLVWDLQHEGRILQGGGHIASWCSTERVAQSRNDATRQFLDHPSGAEWLFMVDSDMGFQGDALEQLVRSADSRDRPVVGALCWAQRIVGIDPRWNTPMYRRVPTLYRSHEEGEEVGFLPLARWEQGSLMHVDGTGAAALLMHRSVLERMSQQYGDNWFTHYDMGEDLSFCRRLREMRVPLHVNTAVEFAHHKPTYLTSETGPPVLVDPTVSMVVPARDRPEHLRRLLDQRQAEQQIVVLDPNATDEVREVAATADVVVEATESNIHKMWNAGWEKVTGDAVAFVNDDVTLGERSLKLLASALDHEPAVWAVCPNYDGREGRGIQPVQHICAGKYDGTGGLAGFCFALRADTPYRFPEDLTWWFGDNDMLATGLLDYRQASGIVLEASCRPDAEASTDWDDPAYAEALAADSATFHAKWDERVKGSAV